jgi:hypothetical protein
MMKPRPKMKSKTTSMEVKLCLRRTLLRRVLRRKP